MWEFHISESSSNPLIQNKGRKASWLSERPEWIFNTMLPGFYLAQQSTDMYKEERAP